MQVLTSHSGGRELSGFGEKPQYRSRRAATTRLWVVCAQHIVERGTSIETSHQAADAVRTQLADYLGDFAVPLEP